MTKTDVVENNADLIAAAAKILAKLPKQTLRLTPIAAAPLQQFTGDCTNIDRVALFLNDRPVASQNVIGNSLKVTLPAPAAAEDTLAANGYRKGELVVGTRLRV